MGLSFGFLGAGSARVRGVEALPGRFNFFLGNDPSRWRRDLRGYRSLEWEGLYPGVRVRMRAGGGGFEYDLLLDPGADLTQVVIRVQGGEGLLLEGDGSLAVKTALGPLRQPLPKAWQVDGAGRRAPVQVRYRVLGPGTFGFEAAGRDSRLALTLDPKLVFSTFVGGKSVDFLHCVDRAGNGDFLLSGYSFSADFPATSGVFQRTKKKASDGVVLRLSSGGNKLVFCTFLGGGGYEGIYFQSLTPGGEIYVYGITTSTDFPTTKNAFMRTNPNSSGMVGSPFLSRLDRWGRRLLASTYVGGKSWDGPGGLWVAPDGSCWASGWTRSYDFPMTSGSWKPYPEADDCFLFHIDGTFSRILFSTIFGGKKDDEVLDLVKGPSDYLYLGGGSKSLDFPVTRGAFQEKFGGGSMDGFVMKVDMARKQIASSTYLGGKDMEWVRALACGKNGSVYCGGKTCSKDFPSTPRAWCKETGGQYSFDLFLARFEPYLKTPVFITTLGGTDQGSRCRDLALDGLGYPVMVGKTSMPSFPATPGAFVDHWRWEKPSYQWDCYLLRMDPLGRKLFYATYLGGSRNDWGYGVCAWGDGMALLVGNTSSKDFPVTGGAFQKTNKGPYLGTGVTGGDGFVTCMRLGVPGVKEIGPGTPHAEGYPALYTTADPVAGSKGFGFESWKAPGVTGGVLLVGFRSVPGGWNWQGGKIYVDPRAGLMVFGLYSGGWPLYKSNRVHLPVPAWAKGLKLVAQAVWFNPGSPFGPKGTFSMSDALEVTVK